MPCANPDCSCDWGVASQTQRQSVTPITTCVGNHVRNPDLWEYRFFGDDQPNHGILVRHHLGCHFAGVLVRRFRASGVVAPTTAGLH